MKNPCKGKLFTIITSLLAVIFIIFSCQKEFVLPEKQLSITSFSPTTAQIGDTITVRGSGFGLPFSTNTISQTNISQFIISGSDSMLRFIVSAGTTTGTFTINKSGQSATSPSPLQITSTVLPEIVITSFFNTMVKIGDTVTVTGRGFGTLLTAPILKVGNTIEEILTISDTLLRFWVLPGTTTDIFTITRAGGTGVSPGVLTVMTPPAGPWLQKVDFPEASASPAGNYIPATGVSVGNRGFIYRANRLFEFVPATNSWTELNRRPATGTNGFSSSSGFSIGNVLYFTVTNVYDGQDVVQLWSYDLATNSWAKKADLPGVQRIAPFSFALNGKGYIGGGRTQAGTMLKDVYRYDPTTDSYLRITDYPGSYTVGISGLTDGLHGYLLDAGPGNPSAPTASAGTGKFYQFKDTTNTWTAMANMPLVGSTVMSAAGFSTGGRIFFKASYAANNSTSNPRNDFQEYVPASNSWVQRADAGGGLRWFGAAFSINGKGYLTLGTRSAMGSFKVDSWEYTPQ